MLLKWVTITVVDKILFNLFTIILNILKAIVISDTLKFTYFNKSHICEKVFLGTWTIWFELDFC